MMKLLLFVFILNAITHLSLSATEQPNHVVKKVSHAEIPNKNNDTKFNSAQAKENVPEVSQSKHDKKGLKSKPATELDKIGDKTQPKENIPTGHNKTKDDMIAPSPNDYNMINEEPGFLKTVSVVLISISLMFMLFVAFKTYRRKSRNARIKKYGIRLTRGNIEMTPLPLDNDDDDETIFDLKNLPT